MQHSKVVGGSTAGRVLNCPGSVALVAKMPPQQGSKYAEEGTLLHACMEVLLDHADLERVVGFFRVRRLGKKVHHRSQDRSEDCLISDRLDRKSKIDDCSVHR
jgi:hypothetical protein